QKFDQVRNGFAKVMREELEKMFAAKLGLATFNAELFSELVKLMMQTSVDYTFFFRELSSIPGDIDPLKKSFYGNVNEEMDQRWSEWLTKWQSLVTSTSEQMKRVNPKYSLREWLLAPAYQQAARGNYDLIHELQDVMTQPYDEQSKEVEEKYYRLKPSEVSELGGVSHMSCSS
ncbi:MAG: protein adenylyltransferase SelO family protein, partial [Thioalkalispiraceae bacterium]